MKFCNPPEDLTEVFPYVISVVADVNKDESCTIYGEEHICGDKSIGITISHVKESIVYAVYTRIGGSKDVKIVSVKNQKPVETDSFSVKIYYNTIMFYEEFLLSEKTSFKLWGDYWRLFGKCKNSKSIRRMSNGSCKRRPCQIHTCHNHFGLRPLDFECVEKRLDPCMDGYCHDGKCEKNAFQQYCDCPSRGFLGLKSPWLGEFCSIRRKEDLDRNMKLLKSTKIDVEFQNNLVLKVEVSSNLDYHYFKCILITLYKIPQFQLAFQKGYCKGTMYSKPYFFYPKVETNQTYAIEVCLHQGSKKKIVFHFIEIDTPGYSVLPPPDDLQIANLPGNIFLLSWDYRGTIPATEYGVKIARKDDKQVDVTPGTEIKLLLQSETPYNFTVTTVNKIGIEGQPSQPLSFTTPRFTEETAEKGQYNFSRWLFKNNTVLLRKDVVTFKSIIRRDARVTQLVIVVHPSTVEVNHVVIFNAVRFNISYIKANNTKPYVAALLESKGIPATLRLGDGLYYGGYYNGYLFRNTSYIVYLVLWYRPLKTIEISVRHIGDYRASAVTWVHVIVSVVISVVLGVFLTLAICHCIQYCSRKKSVHFSEKASVTDATYLNDLLDYPQVDITLKELPTPIKSSFSFVINEPKNRQFRGNGDSDDSDYYDDPIQFGQMS